MASHRGLRTPWQRQGSIPGRPDDIRFPIDPGDDSPPIACTTSGAFIFDTDRSGYCSRRRRISHRRILRAGKRRSALHTKPAIMRMGAAAETLPRASGHNAKQSDARNSSNCKDAKTTRRHAFRLSCHLLAGRNDRQGGGLLFGATAHRPKMD